MDQVANNLGDGTPPNHRLGRLYSGRLLFTLQCDFGTIDFRGNKGHHLNFSPEDEVPYFNRMGEVMGDQRVARQYFYFSHENQNLHNPRRQIAITNHGWRDGSTKEWSWADYFGRPQGDWKHQTPRRGYSNLHTPRLSKSPCHDWNWTYRWIAVYIN